jgi:hypothetical protein
MIATESRSRGDRTQSTFARRAIGSFALAAVLLAASTDARAFDESKYPDLKRQWLRLDDLRWADPNDAPLTAEYRAKFDASLKERAAGGPGLDPTATCLPPGMPRAMIGYGPMEVVVTPHTTRILLQHVHDSRRIFTDGRDWPDGIEPAFAGYSIGTWIDEDGDGRYDALMVETRGFKGPRTFDDSGLPLHDDDQTVVKERIHLDKSDRNLLRDDVTVIDNALTRPWTVTRSYRRDPNSRPVWREVVCAERNKYVVIGKENYLQGEDGNLMPAREGQAPPDLRYFNKARK